MAKIKSVARLRGVEQHNNRDLTSVNVDPNKIEQNELVTGQAEIVEGVKSRLDLVKQSTGRAIRKDAVLAQEYILNASPEFFEDLDKKTEKRWIEKNVEFLEKMYGSENVVNVTAHRDEDHLHLHAIVVPVHEKDGKTRLSAKHYTGGTSHRLRELQTSYAKEMEEFGLERGSKDQKVEYKDLQEYKQETARHAAQVQEIMESESSDKVSIMNAQRLAKEQQEKIKALRAQIRRQEGENKRMVERHKREKEKLVNSRIRENKEYLVLLANIAKGKIKQKELGVALEQVGKRKATRGETIAQKISDTVGKNRMFQEVKKKREQKQENKRGRDDNEWTPDF